MLMILLCIAALLINYTPFQNFLATRATQYLAKRLHTTVSVQRVQIDLLNHVHLKGLFIADQKGDTLLYAGDAEVRTSDWFLISKQTPTLKFLSLSDAKVHLYRTEYSDTWNYQFVIDAFTPSTPKRKKQKQDFELDLKKLELHKVKFDVDDAWRGNDMNFYVGNFALQANEVNLLKRNISIEEITASDTRVVMRDYPGGKQKQQQQNALKAKDATSTHSLREKKPIDTTAFNKENWQITAAKLGLENCLFSFDVDFDKPLYRQFDPEHIHISGINIDAANIRIDKDTITGKIALLQAKERSGIAIKEMRADVSVSPRASICRNLYLATNDSKLYDYYAMHYERFPDFEDYIYKVKMVGRFKNSRVNMNDIAYFAPQVKQYAGVYTLSGEVAGTVNELIGENLIVNNGTTSLTGNLSVKGLPDVDKMFFDFTKGTVKTTGKELMKFVPQLRKEKSIAWHELSYLHFQGDFHGYVNDFVTKGILHTNMGTVVSDIKMELPGNAASKYSGTVTTARFDLGTLLYIPHLGKVSGSATVAGAGFDPQSASININGKIAAIEYNGYFYQNIIAEGVLAKNQFSGKMIIDDSHAKGSFAGSVDFREKNMVIKANSSLSHLALKPLGIADDNYVIAMQADLNFVGTNIDNFLGNAHVRSLSIQRDSSLVYLDSVALRSYTEADGKKTIAIESDAAAGYVTGTFQLTNLIASAQYYLYRYLPSYVRKPKDYAPEQDIDFRIVTRNLDTLLHVLSPKLDGFENAVLLGSFNTTTRDLQTTINIPYGALGPVKFVNASLNGFGDFDKLTLLADFENFRYGDTIVSTSMKVNTNLSNDSMVFDVATISPNSIGTAKLKGQALARGNRLNIKLFPSEIWLNNAAWKIPGGNHIIFRSDYLEVKKLLLQSGNQEIAIHTEDELSAPKLIFDVHHLDVTNISGLIKQAAEYQPAGELNGVLSIENILTHPYLVANMRADELKLGKEQLGNLRLLATYDVANKYLRIDKGTQLMKDGRGISLWSNMTVDEQYNQDIEGEIILSNTPLSWATSFMAGLVSDVAGAANGSITLGGTTRNPDFSGIIKIDSVSAHVNYTGTVYKIPSASISVNERQFALGNTLVYDRFNNTANLSGNVTHRFFRNLNLNLQLRSANFEVVDLKAWENEIFYGNAICNAQFSINGPFDDLSMNIRATPTQRSHIYLPIQYGEGSTSSSSFITFTQSDTTSSRYAKRSKNKLSINLAATANPLLDVTLIIDPVAGDEINARGSGSIALEVPSENDMRMYGTFYIDEGDYTFTFQNLGFRRKFDILQGSKINFYGPFSSTSLNVHAVKEERVQLYDLLTAEQKREPIAQSNTSGGTTNSDKLTQRLLVKLEMTGSLDNPQYDYQLELPDNRSLSTPGYIRFLQVNQNKNDLLAQVASLLILGTFMPTQANDVGLNVLSTAANNVANIFSSTASSQLSNFLARMLNDDDIAVDLKYKNYNLAEAGNLTGLNRNEIKLGLRKNYFNDRMIIELGSSYDWGRPTATAATNSNFNLAGDFRVQYLITPEGTVRINAFRVSNYDIFMGKNVTRGGVGLTYRKSFNTLGDLFSGKRTPQPIEPPKLLPEPTLSPQEDTSRKVSGLFIGPQVFY